VGLLSLLKKGDDVVEELFLTTEAGSSNGVAPRTCCSLLAHFLKQLLRHARILTLFSDFPNLFPEGFLFFRFILHIHPSNIR